MAGGRGSPVPAPFPRVPWERGRDGRTQEDVGPAAGPRPEPRRLAGAGLEIRFPDFPG